MTVPKMQFHCPIAFGHVHCIDKSTHKTIWKKNVWADFGGEKVSTWAITQHPLIYGDLLILASQTEKAGVVAYDKLTGSVQWASPALPGNPGYVSPKVINIGGDDQLVMISAYSKRVALFLYLNHSRTGSIASSDEESAITYLCYIRDRDSTLPTSIGPKGFAAF